VTTPDAALDSLARAYQAASPHLPGGAGWQRRRAAAMERLLRHGLPDRRDENWRYLDWSEMARRNAAPASPAPVPAAQPAGLLADVPPGRTVLVVDGRCVIPQAVSLPGVSIQGLADALTRDPGLLSDALRVPGDDADDRYALLAEAFTDDGVVIRVDDDADAGEFLYLVHASSGRAPSTTRVLVDAGRRSRLRLVEHFIGTDGEASLANLACEIRLADGATVEHLRLHQQQASAAQVETLQLTQARDSQYRQQLFMLGGRLLRSNLHARLDGQAASCELSGLFMVDGSRQADLYTLIEHVAAHTRSRELVRGVATDRGRGAFNGRILVGPGAAKADSSQSSRNLLLSPLAEIDARPQLEILTDDVKCSHGATTGSLDPNQLFYLLSRGIDAETARGLLTFAFCEDVVSQVAEPSLRRQIEELVVGRLPDRDIIREFL